MSANSKDGFFGLSKVKLKIFRNTAWCKLLPLATTVNKTLITNAGNSTQALHLSCLVYGFAHMTSPCNWAPSGI